MIWKWNKKKNLVWFFRMITTETNERLKNLILQANKLYDEKEELSVKLKEELGADKVKLISVDAIIYNMYLWFSSENKDIKTIAESLGYSLEHTYTNKENFIYQLKVKG